LGRDKTTEDDLPGALSGTVLGCVLRRADVS
jgi:hypothetical protein